MNSKRIATHPRRQARREAAAKRQAARDARSPLEQINLLVSRPGSSAREYRRLWKLMTS